MPSLASTIADGALPVARAAFQGIVALKPIVHVCMDKVSAARAAVRPYNLEEYTELIIGIVLLFFGGFFANLIAAVTAFRIVAWPKTKSSFRIVADTRSWSARQCQGRQGRCDGDGQADVKQMADNEWVEHKMLVAAKAVEPAELSEALGAIWTGFIAVFATLRLQFARAITLGCNVGEHLARPAKAHLLPALLPAVHGEYRKWIPVVIDYICRIIGVSVS